MAALIRLDSDPAATARAQRFALWACGQRHIFGDRIPFAAGLAASGPFGIDCAATVAGKGLGLFGHGVLAR